MAMNVTELARAAGVPPHVVRYYARIGLLHPARNPVNGYRLFGAADLERLRLARGLRALGCGLDEVRRAIEAMERGEEAGERTLYEILERQLERTRQEMAVLRMREHVLARLVGRRPRRSPRRVVRRRVSELGA